ncbi:MAG: hypothetical protein KAU21_15155, partial [Gammaproteobacteria bacterium]|nr:hypothetical protein [Gammaproteobacteria bacterium]
MFSSVHAKDTPKKYVEFVHQLNAAKTNKMLLPSDVAVLRELVYVIDGGHHRVLVFNLAGEYQFGFGQHGKGKGEFEYPVGID